MMAADTSAAHDPYWIGIVFLGMSQVYTYHGQFKVCNIAQVGREDLAYSNREFPQRGKKKVFRRV
jgi:hypothetical protein